MVAIGKRVGFGPRLGALAIDAVLMSVLAFVVGPLVGGFLGAALFRGAGGAGAALGGFAGAFAGIIIGLVVIGNLYYLVEGFTGWTLGKLLLGFRIASADGSPARLPILLARWALKNNATILMLLSVVTGLRVLRMLGGLGSFVIFIGCFFALGAARQALHDTVVKTAVFRRRDLAGVSAASPVVAASARAAGAAAPARVTSVAPGERRQCPKCGLSETEFAPPLGWYCRVCHWWESRG